MVSKQSGNPPVWMKIDDPTETIKGWDKDRLSWLDLNRQIGGHPGFSPITIKAGHVMGIIHAICFSVHLLLHATNRVDMTYFPAYGVAASGVELLGRCIKGDSDSSSATDRLKTGLKWLRQSQYNGVQDDDLLITTLTASYTVRQLAELRHFSAHGQAMVSDSFLSFDYEILEKMYPILLDGLERYWEALRTSESACNNLARAKVVAYRDWPISNIWHLFQGVTGKGAGITQVFSEFDWKVPKS